MEFLRIGCLEILNLRSKVNMRDLGENDRMKVEVYPLDKIVIDGKSICLGMEQSAVESVIGKGELIGKRCYYYGNELAIDYDEDRKVEFIEFLGGAEGSLRPIVHGVSVFETSADELIEILKEKTTGEITELEKGYSIIFKDSSIGLYKTIRREDVLEMIEEMKAEGISIENNEDIEMEMKKSNYWASFGIGIRDYY